MVTVEKLQRELRDIDGRIEDLQETRYQVIADLRMVRGRVGLLRRLSVHWLQRDLSRQIQHLYLRRRMVHNCYVEAARREGRRPSRPERRRGIAATLSRGVGML
jgi:hypothetical protein